MGFTGIYSKVKEGNGQETAQSERKSLSKTRGGKKSKLTIRHFHHENISGKPNKQRFSQKVATQLPKLN